MCGISGVLHTEADRPASRDLVDRMTRVLAHRGPDDHGVFISGSVGLGHRRLAIIDLASGRQPMVSEDRRSAVVFNGEIYNYRALQRELTDKGYRFRTASDTEVILHAYQEHGKDCVARFRGMFAFALWDERKKTLLLARDRVGIKPLYYYWDGHTLLFASEIKAILEDPTVPRDLDLRALDDYLTYLYIPAPKTIFKRISKLRPGRTLTVSSLGLREEEYWDLSFEPDEGRSQSECAAGLLEQLREAVDSHLMSDVPLGAFLSGGLDSTAVVALMSTLLDRPVRTASIGFREAGFDELPYARLAADRLRTDAYEQIVDADAATIFDALVWHYDEPFADSSMVPTYYVSRVAREQVKVALSGDGGDEIFAGYRRYRFDVLENRVRSLLPAGLRRPLFGTLGRIYPKADWLPRVFRAKTLLTNLALPPERAYFKTMSWFTPAMKDALYSSDLKKALDGYDAFSVMAEYFERSRHWDPLSRIQYVDIKTYLPDDILTKVDRASMAHSLEVRVPLLDHRVMEYAAGIPSALKLRRGQGKYIFKQAVKDLVPPEVMARRKMGFSLPLARWFRKDLKAVFERQVCANDGFLGSLFDVGVIEQWWKQHQRGTRDYSAHLWALLMLECWGRRFRARL